ncbi:MAG: hypothetical protein ABSA39_05275 [Edaphobacter sp.]
MSGTSVSIQRIAFRFSPFVLLFLAYAASLPHAIGQSNSGSVKSFHDDVLNITYFYPATFVTAPPNSTPTGSSKCIQSTFFAYSVTPIESSSFALSTIDGTCPETLRTAIELGPFTREQVLHQLKQYGEPQIIQEPSRYAIAGHPTAITVASVAIPAAPGKVAQVVYAAQACALGNTPVKSHKRSDPAEPVTHVVCFDFTTQNGGMLSEMFSFIIQFDNSQPQPMFPSSVVRTTEAPTSR